MIRRQRRKNRKEKKPNDIHDRKTTLAEELSAQVPDSYLSAIAYRNLMVRFADRCGKNLRLSVVRLRILMLR